MTTALGAGLHAHLSALDAQRSGLRPCAFEDVDLPGWIGRVAGLEDAGLPPALRDYESRNNRLAWLALQQDGFAEAVLAARERWGAHRIAVLLGTSTSAILESEHAYRRRGPDGALPADFSYAH
ncbi:MAG: beta-ketoacyl-[acyl-carrier-protein] synthase II, partial [Gemmatimonadetes bacterium]|nr:beta-ketoacyl-[acyl-carrier-protein] synthase II [Gemmatimonadota bacterium]